MAPHIPHPHLHSHSHPSSSASSPASPKGARYAATLDAARRLALFTHPSPALAKGALNTSAAAQLAEAQQVGAGPAAAAGAATTQGGMDWNELLRKFRKHNPSREGASGLFLPWRMLDDEERAEREGGLGPRSSSSRSTAVRHVELLRRRLRSVTARLLTAISPREPGRAPLTACLSPHPARTQ